MRPVEPRTPAYTTYAPGPASAITSAPTTSARRGRVARPHASKAVVHGRAVQPIVVPTTNPHPTRTAPKRDWRYQNGPSEGLSPAATLIGENTNDTTIA